LRPSRGLRSGATRATALRRQHGPLVRLRGAPGTQARPRSNEHGFRSTRTAFRRPPGSRETERAEPTFAGRRPPLRFRSSSEVHRSTPAPSREPEGSPSDDASSPGLSCPSTHAGAADPFPRSVQAPRRATSGVSTPFAASTTVPPAPCGAERPWASPCKAFSSKRSGPLAKPHAFLAFAASIRLAPLGSVRTRSPSRLRSRLELVLPFRIPKDPARRCLPGYSPFRAPIPRLSRPLWFRGAIPSHALGGIRRPVPPASQGVAVRETWPPLSGWPALVGLFTDDVIEAA